MECSEILQANDLVKRFHRLCKGLWGPEVVASREGVARVNADAHPRLIVHISDDIPEVLEFASNNIARPCHVLQHRDNLVRLLMCAVQHLRDPPARLPHVCAPRAPGVEVVQANSQLIAPLQVVQEAVVCLAGLGSIRLREVDEIAAVREDVLGRVVGVGGGEGAVLRADVWVQRRVIPLALGLEEESEGIGANVGCVLDSVLDA